MSTTAVRESLAPDGTVYRIPTVDELRSSFGEVARAAEDHRRGGGTVVAVQGLGFVGAAMAAAVAGATDGDGRPRHFVVGVDLPTEASYWKAAKVDAGLAPVASPDRSLDDAIRHAARVAGNLRATTVEEAYGLADVVVVDVHLDVRTRVARTADEIAVDLEGFEAAIRAIGRTMRPDALVVIETTVPIGTTERVARPILEEEREARGIDAPVLLANAYERVMPGPRYLESVRSYPRSYAGIDAASTRRVRDFLESFADPGGLWQLGDTASSELGKLLENSYRATNIAFIHEWTLLAERIGINLFEVVDSIRVRKGTHDNMRYPGLGVGGYCLTKDSLLAQWGATHLFQSDAVLDQTLAALRVNHAMPLHTAELVDELAGGLEARRVVVCGVSYIADVVDTRNSPTETLVGELERRGAEVGVHDPGVREWAERPDLDVVADLKAALDGADGVVFAVPHGEYALSPEELARMVPEGAFVVDGFNVISDEHARVLHDAGRATAGVGKGHWRRMGYHRLR
ncbi:MAG: nucleotide sugar dehydrogenase [Actinobacteria bacterium]|nr:nucleotide sugar dehydrogenase [Actinomycetota bacterium]